MEKIPEQKHVSWGVTFNVSWAGIRRRFFRSLVTMSGVVLAIAFLTYMQIMNKIVNALIEAHDPVLDAICKPRAWKSMRAAPTTAFCC